MEMRYPEFAKRFKQACEAANMPQAQIALGKKLGVSGPMIHAYRNGDKLPSSDTLGRIANKLNVSIDWLINGESQISQDELQLLHLYRKSPDEVKKMIQFVAESGAIATQEITKNPA